MIYLMLCISRILDNYSGKSFKDTRIELIYGEEEVISVWSNYQELIDVLLEHGKDDLVQKVIKSMNGHFIKLRDSAREERKY